MEEAAIKDRFFWLHSNFVANKAKDILCAITVRVNSLFSAGIFGK